MKSPAIPENEKARQAALDYYELLDSLPEDTFDDLTLIASQICQTPIALISLVDSGRQWFKSKHGFELEETSRDVSFCAHAINTPYEVLVVNNTLEDERFFDNPLVTGENAVRFYAGVPLVDHADNALGTICVMDNKPKQLSEGQILAMKALSREIMTRIRLRKNTLHLEEKNLEKKSELQILMENNLRYQSLIKNSPLGINLSDLEGNTIQTNKVFEKMLGYTQGEMKAMSIKDFTFPEDIELSKNSIDKMLTGELENFSIEKRYLSKTGEIVWGSVSSSIVSDMYGNPTYLMAVIEDITLKKKQEKESYINAERLDLAIKGANEGIWDQVDLSSDKEWWSPRYFELIGYKEGEIEPSYSSFRNILLHPDDIELLDKGMEDCFERGIPLDIEHRIRRKDGTYQWFRGKGDFSRDETGTPIRMTGSITSIEKQKKLEAKLSRTERFLKKVTEIAPSIIYIFNQESMSNEYTNRELGEILGYSFDEIKEMGNQLMSQVCHPDDLNLVLKHFEKIKDLQNEETVSLEYRMKNKEGHYRWLLSEDTVFDRDEKGKVLKHLGVATDITKLKESEDKLLTQAQVLKSRNEDLRQFTYIASHDLKNPMITLEGHFNYLQSKVKSEEIEVQESITFINEEIAQFKKVITGLKEAINLRELEVAKCYLSINEIIESVVCSFKGQIDKIGGRFKLELEENVEVLGTTLYLNSIIFNLISNAIKYRSEDRLLNVEIHSYREKGWLNIRIKDNGRGMNLKLHKERMFKMFNRFHDDVEGSGMGLYMAKNMIEKIGGTVHLESEEGVGTVFFIKLEANGEKT